MRKGEERRSRMGRRHETVGVTQKLRRRARDGLADNYLSPYQTFIIPMRTGRRQGRGTAVLNTDGSMLASAKFLTSF